MGRPLFLAFGFDELLERREVFEEEQILVLFYINAIFKSLSHRLLE